MPNVDPDPIKKSEGVISAEEALVDMGHGKLVPASQVKQSAYSEINYTYKNIIKKQSSPDLLPIDAGSKSVLQGVANGFAYVHFFTSSQLSGSEMSRWSEQGLRITDVFDFDAIEAISSGTFKADRDGVWQHRSGRGPGVFTLNADGVKIELQRVSYWTVNSVEVMRDRRKIIMWGNNPLSGGFNEIAHIKFKRYQESLFLKVAKLLGY